jgi:hypothetical protein
MSVGAGVSESRWKAVARIGGLLSGLGAVVGAVALAYLSIATAREATELARLHRDEATLQIRIGEEQEKLKGVSGELEIANGKLKASKDLLVEVSEGNTTIPPEIREKIQSATASTSPHWFAVLASVAATNPASAKDLADRKLTSLQSIGLPYDVQLFKTKISNSLAVVLGGPLDRTKAFQLASQARSKRIAADAFAQQDRGWTFVGRAPFK